MNVAKSPRGLVCAGLLALSTALSGCAAWLPDSKSEQDHEERFHQVMRKYQESIVKQTEARRFLADSPWLVESEVFHRREYPRLDGIELAVSEQYKTLPQIINRLGLLTDVSFHLSEDLFLDPEDRDYEVDDDRRRTAQTDSAGNTAAPGGGALQILRGAATGDLRDSRFSDPTKTPISFTVNGPLPRILNAITSQLGINWRYEPTEDQVEFYRLSQKNFQIFFPGESDTTVSVGNRGGGADKVIDQRSEFRFDGGTWNEINEAISALLSPWGQAVVVKSTGNVVVTDTPRSVKAVEEYIGDVNEIYGRQVYLQIQTASVTLNDSNDFNLTWNNILNVVNSGEFALGLDSATVPTSGLPTAANVIRRANGASLALELLATQAYATETNEQAVTTVSNQPASLKVLADTGYISGISQQATAVGADNIISDVETDTVQTGFDATLLPRVVNKNSLQLQVAMELSGNLSLVNFDETLVQTPALDRNTVVQRAWLKSGETWVIAAFNSNKATDDETGVGSSGFWGLGGGTSKTKEQKVLLVLITPHIQDGAYQE